jgi:hypothetical protein
MPFSETFLLSVADPCYGIKSGDSVAVPVAGGITVAGALAD